MLCGRKNTEKSRHDRAMVSIGGEACELLPGPEPKPKPKPRLRGYFLAALSRHEGIGRKRKRAGGVVMMDDKSHGCEERGRGRARGRER
jgi:hypothetical protein